MGEPKEARNMVRVEQSIGAIDRDHWEACANPATRPYNPFISYDFLKALEDSGSVSADTGWLPQHLVMTSEAGAVVGCMPCYLKSHSQGEYVFDYGWANAFESAGGSYYPKLQCSVPFTPATGRRLLVRDDDDRAENETLLAYAAVQLTKRLDASSLHMTFLTEAEWDHLGELGLLRRTDQQFHWFNQDYGSFDDYLAALASRKRKAVKRERRAACGNGVTIELITGDDIGEEHWDAFFAFYMDTGSRKWGSPYLNRDFFSLVTETMRDRILLIMCKHEGRYVAGALNFIGGDTLYGRYWGCIEDHPFLHFETCYYQAIEIAIERGLTWVEAGAQGEHKLSRGYLPVTTYSAHFIASRGLSQAVEDYLEREREAVALESRILHGHSPFKQTPGLDLGDET